MQPTYEVRPCQCLPWCVLPPESRLRSWRESLLRPENLVWCHRDREAAISFVIDKH